MSGGKRESGFTLMEMMAVVIIIGILAAMIIPRYSRYVDTSKINTTRAQIKVIVGAIEQFKMDTGRYPASGEGLSALIAKPADYKGTWPRDGYLPEVPLDSWGNSLVYACPGRTGSYDIMSYGADGKEGGEDENADIVD